MECFVLLVPPFTLHEVCEKCLLTSGSLFMSQWFFHWASVCFFFISLTFFLHMRKGQRQLDWHAVRQAMPFRWWSINTFLRACMCVLICACVRECVWVKRGIVRTWPAHFACSSRDRCSWVSTGAWQLPFIAVFSTLNPWPALPPSSSSSSSSPLSSLPPSSTSDLFSRHFPRPSRMMDCEGWWAGCALYVVVVGCGGLTLSDHGNPAVQTESDTHIHLRPQTLIPTPQVFVQQSVIPSTVAVKHLIKRA